MEITEYRSQLYEYLKSRMIAVAPNLTILVGELVGARLIAHAGSLMNLAKHPASTVQILGAEKALFRALKTKHDTPKYGLIYHAQLVGQSSTKLKGKMSRMLAAKAALACRVDALGDDVTSDLGAEHRAKLESRLRMLEQGGQVRISGTGKQKAKFDRYENKSEVKQYAAAADSTIPTKRKLDEAAASTPKRLKVEDEAVAEVKDETQSAKKKKKKKDAEQKEMEVEADKSLVQETVAAEEPTSAKKKKKIKTEAAEVPTEAAAVKAAQEATAEVTESAKKKKKKAKREAEEAAEVPEAAVVAAPAELDASVTGDGEGKKKKKKKAE